MPFQASMIENNVLSILIFSILIKKKPSENT